MMTAANEPNVTNRKPLREFLHERRACADALAWATKYNGDYTKAWAECERGDWMLWIAARHGLDRKKVVLVACEIVDAALTKYWKRDDDRPKKCIEVARAWCAGTATISQVRDAYWACSEARRKAWNEYYSARTDAAADAAAYAADAAAYAAADAAYAAAYAAYAAADAAAYAADAAADAAAREAARRAAWKEQAELVRKHISADDLIALLPKE